MTKAKKKSRTKASPKTLEIAVSATERKDLEFVAQFRGESVEQLVRRVGVDVILDVYRQALVDREKALVANHGVS